MKKLIYIACGFSTLIIWCVSAFLILDVVVFVSSAVDVIFGGLILGYATLATAVVWWMPRILQFPEIGEQVSPPAKVTEISHPNKPLSQPELRVWWKLAFASSFLSVVTFPVWLALHFGELSDILPIPFVPALYVVLSIPAVYLCIFSLWHWRTRYAGQHHLAWLILFCITAWPLFQFLPASTVVAVVYCFVHLVPDARGSGAYIFPLKVEFPPLATPLPERYKIIKSSCFVLGWSLIIGSILAAITTCIADIVIWNSFQQTIPHHTGKIFSEAVASALWIASQIAKTSSATCLISTIACAIGAVLIQISQSLRWKLLDNEERLKMLDIQQKPSSEPPTSARTG